MIQLRSNQKEPIEKAIEFFNKKNKQKPSLMVLPTAWGKSILIARVANKINDKILVIQPSKELLEQNYFKYINLCKDETTVSIYSASFNSKEIAQVTFCTIGSIKSKGNEFKKMGFNKILIDEAHMYPREDTGMLRTFVNDLNPTHILGVTATPFKLQTNSDINGNSFSKLVCLTNRSKKGNFFKEILHVSQIQEMIELKFWSPLEYLQEELDDSNLIFNSTKAEFTELSVEKTFELNDIESRVYKALEYLKKQCFCKHILIFVPSIDIAIRMQKKYKGGVVFSGMNPKDRDEVISDFKKGKLSHIFNVKILSVGFDYTEVDGIILGYPTASLTNYYQIIGRGTRININKQKCVIYDLGGNYRRFGKIEDLKLVQLAGYYEMISGNKLVTSTPIHLLENDFTLWFGKYRGIPLEEVPDSYLEWVLENVKIDNLTKKQIFLRLSKF